MHWMLGSAAAIGLGAIPSRTLAAASVDVPIGSMLLSRQLERSLRDGADVTVRRSWQVEFSPQGRGFMVRGRQVAVEVSAPENLARLAQIEEERSTADMWPLLLSADGRLMGAGDAVREADLSAALREAESMIAARDINAGKRATQVQLLEAMTRAGSSLLEALPEDLFFPDSTQLHAVRDVQLPGGLKGEFELRYNAVPVSRSGWLDHARREVVTRIEETEQRASEEWRLASL